MPLIIDTYNLLHVTGVLPPDLAGIDTEGLIGLLETSRYRTQDVILACDGHPAPGSPKGRFGSISVRYSGSERTADDLITKFVDRSSIPRRLLVVSSDRAILKAARRRRCQIITSEQFLGHLAFDAKAVESAKVGSSKSPLPLSEEEIRQWTLEFDVDEQALESEVHDFQHPNEREKADQKSEIPEPATHEAKEQVPLEPSPPKILPDDLIHEAQRLIESDQQGTPPIIPPSIPPTNPDTMDP